MTTRTTNSRIVLLNVIMAAIATTIAGCGSSHEMPLAQVQGTVMLDGKPLSQGQIFFTPKQGRGAQATIGSDGSFTLSTYDEGDGAIVGLHRVTVTSRESPGDARDIEAPKVSLIPARYADAATSGLQYDVQPGTNEFQIDLTTDPN